ncbi:response regulator transcription factor [Oscillatoria sp. CS-180]|uniref:response regulator transcription factor NblR n=1 Tax=Oscillatoria sp. CS-180 TaxID=3021720 RepID=UPI00232E238C|nr:response regulator transcription factor [Oscillatoria sp. CS-180]MDB9525584.1 response regulator transcription factor [Oscillatoria sp. CS-180]
MESHADNVAPKVLLICSNGDLTDRIRHDLEEVGYGVETATTGAKGIEKAKKIQPALIIIDRLLGSDSGLNVCQKLRSAQFCVPILLLMARDTLEDRIACLEAGADDYCLKPYQEDAFLKIVQIYLQPGDTSSEQLRFSDLALDLGTRTASRNGREIDLTMKEFELLRYLMEHPREVLAREQILENVWGYDFMGESNVIEVYVRYLRLKIDGNNEKRLIQTVRGVGYVLRES